MPAPSRHDRPDPPAAPRSTASTPRQPWLHELVVAVWGNVTAVSDHCGDIASDGAQGVYVDDRRVVSVLDVELAGERPAPVAHGALGAHAEFFGSARTLGSTTPDPVVEVRRSRDLVAGGLLERVQVVSRADRQVTGALRLRIASDGAPIATVKSGLTDLARLPPTLSAHGAVFCDDWHETRVALEPAPARLIEADGAVEAWFDVDLGPGDASEVVLRVTTTRRRGSNLDADPGGSRVRWPLRVTGDDPRLEPTVDAAVADLRALVLTDPEAPGEVFTAAGTPWYLTLFGRDSIWAAQLTLPLGTDLAHGTLRALGRRQGVRHDPLSGEAPGKIPHEVRRVPYVDPATGMSLPAVYFGSVDATALWVVLLHDAWRWGLSDDAVRALFDVLDMAVGWLTGDAVPDPDGLLKYLDDTGLGLSNQGWKDSGDAIRFRDGRLGAAPIALVEAQAYTVHALECAATLADAFGRGGADHLRKRAEDLRGRVRDHYWVTDQVDEGRKNAGPVDADPPRAVLGRYLGLAVDGTGRLVDGLASNMGHTLGTSTLTRDEAALVAAALTGPELLDRFGVRTLGTGNGGYNPIGYHTGSIWTHDTAIAALGLAAEGFRSEAVTVARTLLASAEAFGYRWPSCTPGSRSWAGPRRTPRRAAPRHGPRPPPWRC